MAFRHKSRTAEIVDIQQGTFLQDILESGVEFTEMIDLNQMTQETFPELAHLTKDVREDLDLKNSSEKTNIEFKKAILAAYDKMDWYFTRGPMAGITTEDEVIGHIGYNSEGAYDINPDAIAEVHIGMYNLYTKLKSHIPAIKKELKGAPSVMYEGG